MWPGRILFDAGALLYLGPGSVAEPHAHHAVQLVWSPRDQIRVDLGEITLQRSVVLIPANEVHALTAIDRQVAVLLLEPHSALGRQLDQLARRELGRELIDDLRAIPFPAAQLAAADASAWSRSVAHALGVTATPATLSSVSRRAIDHIEQTIDRTIDRVPRLGDAAKSIGLSPTRLTHIFTREVGIPFRRFVVWTRIKRAVVAFQGGNDLTTSAMAAGFTDAAHFSRTFRSMFGLSPSLILSTAEVVGDVWRPR